MGKPDRATNARTTGRGDSVGCRVVYKGWERLFDEAMTCGGLTATIRPFFIKRGTVERLLTRRVPATIEVLTRFNPRHFCDEVSDVEALALLLEHGAAVRCVRNLHAKVYHFGTVRAIVTLANLTRSALRSNHEFGFVLAAPEILQARITLTRCGPRPALTSQLNESLAGKKLSRVTAHVVRRPTWKGWVTRGWTLDLRARGLIFFPRNRFPFGRSSSSSGVPRIVPTAPCLSAIKSMH